ncbi:MAG TPA: hypothetical protein VLF93_00795 [Candidatus Saccharimonadales bacterium]|nr:hypothetical protein [Candidatus Saccharimonadales bacterium]
MDPSTPSAQDGANEQSSNPPVNQAQQPAPPAQTPKQTMTISVGNEGEPAVIAAESPDADSDEEEIKVAPQEAKNQGVQQGAGVEQEESVEIQPSVPEVSVSPEVEHVVEKSVDQEKPELPKVVKSAGVTHSGPGVIKVDQNSFGVKKLPVTYQQAAAEEKVTQLHDSKHWLMGMIMYIWRKLNPKIGTKDASSVTSSASTVIQQPIQLAQQPATPAQSVQQLQEEKGEEAVLTGTQQI